MAIYGTQPKPRLLLINCADEDLELYHLGALFPTIKTIDENELDTVRQAEFDVAIALQPQRLLPLNDHLHVVYIGSDELPGLHKSHGHTVWTDVRTSHSSEFIIEDTLNEDMHKLTKDTLLPLAKSKSSNGILISRADGRVVNLWSSLIADGDGNALAGHMQRRQAEIQEFWYFPFDLPETALMPWMKLLLQRWALMNPQTFSFSGDWREMPDWQSADELRASRTISAEQAAFKKLSRQHEEKLAGLADSYRRTQAEANAHQRVLLTGQGTALKDEVAVSLKYLGFDVQDMDSQQEKGDMLEDLKATDTLEDGSTWTTLIEVRSYQKGAQLKDLMRIGRFIKRHLKEHGVAPDAAWYVVNHFINRAPDDRELALTSNKPEVDVFEEDDNGLVIDTTMLFQLRKQVESGELSKDDARQLLRESTGYFKIET